MKMLRSLRILMAIANGLRLVRQPGIYPRTHGSQLLLSFTQRVRAHFIQTVA